jgi:hypothetical protein
VGLAQSNEPIRRRYGYLALADDRPVFAYPTTLFYPSYCFNAL